LKYADPSGHCFWDACIVEGIAAAALVEGALFVIGATSVIIWNSSSAAPKEIPRTDKPKLTVIEGGKNNKNNNNSQNQPKGPVAQPKQNDQNKKQEKVILYHYTTKAGYEGILSSNKIFASTKALRPNDARYGDGVYLTDIAPNSMSNRQLSQTMFNNPNQTDRIGYYIGIDITDLVIKYGRENVYVYLTGTYLDISERLVSSGVNNGNGKIM